MMDAKDLRAHSNFSQNFITLLCPCSAIHGASRIVPVIYKSVLDAVLRILDYQDGRLCTLNRRSIPSAWMISQPLGLRLVQVSIEWIAMIRNVDA